MTIIILLGFLTAIAGAILFFTTQHKKAATAIFVLGFGFAVGLIILLGFALQTM